ncbi:zinc transporter ZIP11 isoform X1 [Homalodisca vitripennis]|uniref:zinc transporter ZIP11 isoform X1 n=2 Tax=Homalodisca vitripennis TaxID=197043 RepID=UPI001EEBD05C|nr:zinc transporter ZIP11 isoform X1 [Homalodisca vitripennis]
MIESDSPLFQTLLGTLFTWGMTAAGAALVVVINGTQRALLDTSLGFAGGVMVAASYWSLLAPSIEMAEQSSYYGDYAFLPAAVGFFLGSLFVYAADILITAYGLQSASIMLAYGSNGYTKKTDGYQMFANDDERSADNATVEGCYEDPYGAGARRRGPPYPASSTLPTHMPHSLPRTQWKRLLLLIVAITVHNIPEGLAVGVGNAAIGSSASATYQSARNLAIGIGLQNFPEGLAVSLPLKAAGFSTFRSFWYGQLSGMVEPVAGLLGVLAISLAQPLLPYALAFAAGAMIYVVFDDIVPEAHSSGNGKLATWGAIIGFLIMMSLDVALG